MTRFFFPPHSKTNSVRPARFRRCREASRVLEWYRGGGAGGGRGAVINTSNEGTQTQKETLVRTTQTKGVFRGDHSPLVLSSQPRY